MTPLHRMAQLDSPVSADRPLGLANLLDVPLPRQQADGLERLLAESLGPAPWRAFKAQALRKLFGLEQVSGGRLEILAADASGDIRAAVRLRGPVACLPPGAAEIVIEPQADLAIFYPEDLLRAPVPGHALIEILAPRHVLHPNVSPGPAQRLCLGVNVGRVFPLHELVLGAYAAISLQAVTVDERDHAGVMNLEAALYWQAHADQMPLTREPFLALTVPQDAS